MEFARYRILLFAIFLVFQNCSKDFEDGSLTENSQEEENRMSSSNSAMTEKKDHIDFKLKAKLFPRYLKSVDAYKEMTNAEVEAENQTYFETIDGSLTQLAADVRTYSNGILQMSYSLEFDHTEITEDYYSRLDENRTYQTCSVSNGLGVQHRQCQESQTNRWSYGGDWNACSAAYCDDNYALKEGTCQLTACTGSSYEVCDFKNADGSKVGGGIKLKTCKSNGKWSNPGSCQLIACDIGYHKINGSCEAVQCEGVLNTINDYSMFDEEYKNLLESGKKSIQFAALFLKPIEDDNSLDKYRVRRIRKNNYATYRQQDWGWFLPIHVGDSTGASNRHEFIHTLDFAFQFSGEPGMIFLHEKGNGSYSSCHPTRTGERGDTMETEDVFVWKVDSSREGDKCTGELLDYCKLENLLGPFQKSTLCSAGETVNPTTLSPEGIENAKAEMQKNCGGKVTLSWDTVPYASYYKIYRDGQLIESEFNKFDIKKTRTKYVDRQGGAKSKKRTYSVFACNSYGCSESSVSLAKCKKNE